MNKITLIRCALLLAAAFLQPVQAEDLKGDAVRGGKLNSQCIGCHGLKGYRASFPEIYRVPMLFGQNEKYLANALAAYQRGDRRHPTMRGVVSNLSEQDMADLAAFYSTSHTEGRAVQTAVASGSSAGAELVKKGGCQGCHGENLSKPIDPGYPKIAGQYADYVAAALRAYKTDGNALVGRKNPMMGGMATQFSNEEIREIAEYVSSLSGELETVPQNRFK